MIASSPGRDLRRQDPEGRQARHLPIEQPTRFELVIDLRTAGRVAFLVNPAQALGFTIPQAGWL